MTPAPAAEPEPLVCTRAPAASDRSMHRRVRLAMYLAFLALAAALLLQGWSTVQLGQRQAADARIVDIASAMRLDTQKIARFAALTTAPDGVGEHAFDALDATLAGAAQAALELQSRLDARRRAADGQALRDAEAAWEAARERLWYRAQALLLRSERAGDAGWDAAVAAVQAEADRANVAARALQSLLRENAQARAEQNEATLRLQMAAMLLLLGVLALAIVEPTARAVRRQVSTLEQQALELRRLALVAENTSALVVVSDAGDRVLWVNPAFKRLTGWDLQQVAGALLIDLMQHPRADAQAQAALRTAVADGQGLRTELLCRRHDGSDLWLDIDLRPLHDDQGQLAGFVSVCTDVSARVLEQGKLRLLWAALPVGVVVRSADGEVVDANRSAARLLRLSHEQLLGRQARDPNWRTVREDLSPYPIDEMPALRTLRSGLALHGETLGVQAADGTQRWLLVNTEPQHDEQGRVTGVISCFSDITERRALQDRLHESARTDALTGLPNRVVVMERVQRALEHARAHPGYGFALLFMDFDRFKQVNDTLGHGAGDELLRQIAARLRLALRPGDEVGRVGSGNDLAARLGGDEFVVVLEGLRDESALRAVADRLLAEMAEPYTVLDNPVQSSASIGLALSAHGAETAEEMLRNADTAMYEAKRAGRGRWVLFDRSMHDRLVHTLAVETDLRRALRDDELFVVYQPVVDLASGELSAVEALVRWQHPERGLVAPADFIAIAEECGLIDAVGQQVLEKACAQFMRWRRELGARAPRQLAVNLSRAQLERPALVGEVMAVLHEAGMSPLALQLEVTESLAAQDERVQGTLRELKANGIRLALDDFGTGYSSLACLHQLPVDSVKIDRSFIRHAESVEYHRVLIEATIRVARTLGMVTVAEGIETGGQAALMRALCCDQGQGWLFGRAMEPAEFERWLGLRQHGAVVV